MNRRVLTGIAAGGQHHGFQATVLRASAGDSSGIGAIKLGAFSATVASVWPARRRVAESRSARSRDAEDLVALTPILGLVRGPL
jgi:hypothetical protein